MSAARIMAWLARRAENVAAAMLAVMFVAFIIQIFFRYVANFPVGWTQELSVILWLWLVLFGAAFVVREREEIRFDIIYGAVGPKARRVMCVITAVALDRTLRRLAAGGGRLRHLHEGGKDGVPEDPVRPALFDLHRLRRRRRSSDTSGWRGRRCAGLRRRSSTRPRRARAYDADQPVLARDRHDDGAGLSRPADRPFDDRGLDPLSAACGPRHGDGRRAAAERHVHQLRDPGRAAVHPGRRVHEHRQHDRPADDVLQRAGRPVSRWACACEHPAEHHLCRHVGIGHRRRGGFRAA